MYPNTLALARSLSKTVIAYDLEHTGIAGEHHCITDFGAMLVTPAGDISSYASLVRPPEGTQFNRIVCRLTGIFPHTVENAPGWERVLEEFVRPNLDALWVGFNSRTTDTPLVYKESQRLGHELAPFTQLDLAEGRAHLRDGTEPAQDITRHCSAAAPSGGCFSPLAESSPADYADCVSRAAAQGTSP
jgi:DNA polymerase III epsilon subunit-like protein